MRQNSKIKVLGSQLSLLLGLTAGPLTAWADQDGILVRIDTSDRLAVSEGYFLYQDHCAACHGQNLEGQLGWDSSQEAEPLAPPHDDTGHSWHHSDDELFEMSKFGFDQLLGLEPGTSGMPGFAEDLSDEQLMAILAFIKSSWSAESAVWQQQVDAQYQASWQPFQSATNQR